MSHIPPDSKELSNPSSSNTSHGTKSWSYVKILTPSIFHSGVMDPLFIIFPSFLVSPSITTLTIHYQPLSISFWSICFLVLSINIITLGSSSINYDFILTSYYPSNRCFTQKLSIPDYNIVISFFIILYMFHSYLCRYIILSFVLCILVFENQLSFSHSSLVIVSWISSSILLGISSLYF